MWYWNSAVSPRVIIWQVHSSANSVFFGTVCNNKLSRLLTGITRSDRWERKKKKPGRTDELFWRIAGVCVCCSRYCDVGEWKTPTELSWAKEFPELNMAKIKQAFKRILRDHDCRHCRSSQQPPLLFHYLSVINIPLRNS